MDAANASLAGALAVSFTVLRFVMLLLVAVFLLSGFFTVGPDEVAVRTRFGKIVSGPEGEVLTAEGGPYFRWPAPIGEVYRIPTITLSLKINESFVFRAAKNSGLPLNEIDQGERLSPEYDGSLLTADKSIVHARYEVQYKVLPEDAAKFIRHVASVADLDTATNDRTLIFKEADLLVRNAVEQAIVEDVAATPLDRFLRGGRSQQVQDAPLEDAPEPQPGAADEDTPSEGTVDGDRPADPADAAAQPEPREPQTGQETTPPELGEVERRNSEAQEVPDAGATPAPEQEDQIKLRAQEVLDELGSGITLVTVARTEQAVVSGVRGSMTLVQTESAVAQRELDAARTFRNDMLGGTAGPAYPAVLAVIDVYEEAYRLRDSNPQVFEHAQQSLRATFMGEPLGPVLVGLADAMPEGSTQGDRLRSLARTYPNSTISGSAGTVVRSASSRASSYLAALESDAESFERLLATYRDKPQLVKRSLLSNALREIFSNPDIETTFIPPGGQLRLQIGRDLQAAREEEQRAREERTERAARRVPQP